MTDVSGSEAKITRRGFVGWAIGLGSGFVALTLGIPMVGSLRKWPGRAPQGHYVKVADLDTIPTGQPFGLSFVEQTSDAYNIEMLPHSIYAIKKSDSEVTVLSPVCPHLGCQVFFDRQGGKFECPCHGSVFAADGARISGPAPRGLDALPAQVRDGALWVRWVQYEPGVAEKTPV